MQLTQYAGSIKYMKNLGMDWVKNWTPKKLLKHLSGTILLPGNPGTEGDWCLC